MSLRQVVPLVLVAIIVWLLTTIYRDFPQVSAATGSMFDSLVGVPTATRTPRPTSTPTETPVPTETPIPTATPWPTAIPTEVPYSYHGYGVGAIGGVMSLDFPLYEGTTLEGYFEIGGQKDITFQILDPFGNPIYNPGKVIGRHSFSVPAYMNGLYRLEFTNCFTCQGRAIGLYWRVKN